MSTFLIPIDQSQYIYHAIRTKTIKNMYNKLKSFIKSKNTKIHADNDISIKQNPFLQWKI